MIKHTPFPPQKEGRFYLTEGGTETELMYKHGFELPYFAMFPLLDNPKAVSKMREMFRSYLDVAARHRFCALMGGLDYRASPDWGELLGYSAASLADANLQSIEFLRELASEYSSQIPEILIQGLIGPRGDAYERNETITADEAEDYHAVQLETLKGAHVDSALAITFNNIPESVGVARAAAKIGVPLGISLTLDSNSKLHSGPSLAEAIAMIDQETDQSP
jgi:homocysteine S-methyltransferase